MAITYGTITAVWNVQTPLGPVKDSNNKAIVTLMVAANFTGTYDQSLNSSILAVPTAIANFMHDGRTYVMLAAQMAAPGDEAGTPIGAKTVAVSSSDLTMELTGGDMATEHAAAVLGAFGRPIAFVVTCSAV